MTDQPQQGARVVSADDLRRLREASSGDFHAREIVNPEVLLERDRARRLGLELREKVEFVKPRRSRVSKRSMQINLRLSPETLAAFCGIADEEDVSYAAAFEIIVTAYAQKHP